MKKYISLIALISLALYLNAQNIDDALRYSQSDITGTARYTSMGGAFGALGGDISAISDNPAGLGTFLYHEFNLTTSFRSSVSNTDYLGSLSDDSKFNFGLNNIAYVGSFRANDKNSALKAINVSFSYRKMDNYAQRIYTEAYNNQYSITEHFADMAYGTPLSKLDDGTGGSDMVYNAYNAHLIDPLDNDPNNIEYKSALSDLGLDQFHSIVKRGRKNEYATSIGLNLNDRLYLGASLTYNTIKYVYDSEYQEVDNQQRIYNFDYLKYRNKFTATGYGSQLKLGAMAKATSWLRLGAAIHTPTVYTMEETYDENSISSQLFKNNKTKNFNSVVGEGSFQYRVITPLKASASIGFTILKRAMIGIDYEFTPYPMARLRSVNAASYFSEENKLIKAVTKNAHNIKIGGEYRWSAFSFRAGFAYLDSPYKSSEINEYAYTLYYNGGFGVNWNSFYLDFAYSFATNQQYYYPYQLDFKNVSAYQIENNRSNYMVTLGFRF